jgi:hypothetical protein
MMVCLSSGGWCGWSVRDAPTLATGALTALLYF